MKIAKLTSIVIVLTTLTTTFSIAQDKFSEYSSKKWKDLAIKIPAAWYGSDEKKLVAENVLLSQKKIVGWEKNKALHQIFKKQTLSQSNQKNRVIILTDIEADPDDTQSLVRLLLYSNQIDIKGIIATTSCWLTNEVHPESIKKVIEAYSK